MQRGREREIARAGGREGERKGERKGERARERDAGGRGERSSSDGQDSLRHHEMHLEFRVWGLEFWFRVLDFRVQCVLGYLAHKKQRPPRTLQ